MTSIRLTHDDYSVGWICALPLEMTAAELVLDNEHERLFQPREDQNTYVLGDRSGHNVVIACLPSGVVGTSSASVVASRMKSTHKNIRFGLLIGVGGGAPSMSNDIRLGDVVVSKPGPSPSGMALSGVVQYDFGKTIHSGKFQRSGGVLDKPPDSLLTAISRVQARHMRGDRFRKFWIFISQVLESMDADSSFHYPGEEKDLLFRADYQHHDPEADCQACDETFRVPRAVRSSTNPRVHYGVIASANQVMKDGRTRDEIARELGILCFEMEAAGLMNHFPCLVVRGICDYADSHKKKEWQEYAALSAAAYGKELLSFISLSEPMVSNAQEADNFTINFASSGIAFDEFSCIGRNDELKNMEMFLIRQISHHTITLNGLGGMGKTHLALEYIERHPDYTAIFWFDATDEATLGKDFVQMAARVWKEKKAPSYLGRIARDMNVKEATKWAMGWLSRPGNKKWLLIFDNYEPTPTFNLRSWFPELRQGHTIITTRSLNVQIGVSLTVSRIASMTDCLLILGAQRRELPRDPDACNLVGDLDRIPHALTIAGAYLNRRKMLNCAGYRELYKKNWLALEDSPSCQFSQDKRLEATWLTSLLNIQQESENAYLILSLWAGLDNKDLWLELVQDATIDFPQLGTDRRIDSGSFSEAMETLCSYHFVEVALEPIYQTSESRGYTLNKCVHSWLKKFWKTSSDQHFGVIALDCLITHSSRFDGDLRQEVCYRMFPHLEHILNLPLHGSLSEEDHYRHARQMHQLGDAFSAANNWLSAPTFTKLVNLLIIRHPTVPGISNLERCLRRVSMLCDKIPERRFQELHIDALEEIVYIHTRTGKIEVFSTILRRLRTCRTPFHSEKTLCARCFFFLSKYIITLSFLSTCVVLLLDVIYTILVTCPWKDLPQEIMRQLAQAGINILLSASLSSWKYRTHMLFLSVALMIMLQMYDLFVLGADGYHFHNLLILVMRFEYVLFRRMMQSKSRTEIIWRMAVAFSLWGCLKFVISRYM